MRAVQTACRILGNSITILAITTQLIFAQKVIDHSSTEPPSWLIGPPTGNYFIYYSGVGSSPNSLSSAKEQSIANVLSEIIMAGMITAESRIETFHQQTNEGIISVVSREIQQTGSSTTIAGLRKEEEYWQTVRTADGLLYQYWILMKISKPEYTGLDLNVEQGYGLAPVWRSALVPGWGQFHKGEKKKGLRLLRSEAVLISIALISSHYSRSYSRKAATERDTGNREFYNEWSDRTYSISMLSGIVAGVIYGYNVFDAVASKGAKKYAVKPEITPTGEMGIVLSFNF